MSFLSGITGATIAPSVPQPTAPKPTGGFLSNVQLPNAAAASRAGTVQRETGASQVSRANSDYANSFKGLATNTVKGLWNASGIPQQFNEGVAASKDKTPGFSGTVGRLSGVASAVSAPLAPVFNPVGAVGKVINAAGNALAGPNPGTKLPNGGKPYLFGVPSDPTKVQRFANSPAGIKTANVAGNVANLANIAGVALGAKEAFTPKVKGGFLDTVDTPAKAEAPAAKPEPAAPAEKPIAQAHAEYAKQQGYKPVETPAAEAPKSPATPRAGEAVQTADESAYQSHSGKFGDTERIPSRIQNNKDSIESLKYQLKTTSPKDGDIKAEIRDEIDQHESWNQDAQKFYDNQQSIKNTPKPESTTEGVGNIKPVEGEGEFHTAGSAASAVASMTKDELIGQVKDLPGFHSENWGHQSDFAADTVTRLNTLQDNIDILEGKKPLPKGMLGSAFTTAAKNYAKLTGNGELAAAVAHSELHLQVSRAAQEMGYLGANADPVDPVRVGREVESARQAVARPEQARQAVETARAARRSTTTITRPRVKEFLKSIECGY